MYAITHLSNPRPLASDPHEDFEAEGKKEGRVEPKCQTQREPGLSYCSTSISKLK